MRNQMYIPNGTGEIMDQLGMMMISSPLFLDKTGYFPDQNIDVVFKELNEGLRLMQKKLGDERYLKLIEMSDQMRRHFEADPEDKTEDSLKGREIIEQMQKLLRQRNAKT